MSHLRLSESKTQSIESIEENLRSFHINEKTKKEEIKNDKRKKEERKEEERDEEEEDVSEIVTHKSKNIFKVYFSF